mgnify:CR=1 FL=1|jgi:hypothetical protein
MILGGGWEALTGGFATTSSKRFINKKFEAQAPAPRGEVSARPEEPGWRRRSGGAGMDRVDDGGAIHSVHPAFPGNYRL